MLLQPMWKRGGGPVDLPQKPHVRKEYYRNRTDAGSLMHHGKQFELPDIDNLEVKRICYWGILTVNTVIISHC